MSKGSKERRDVRKRKRERRVNKKRSLPPKKYGLAVTLTIFGFGIICLGALISGPFWYELLVKPPGATRMVALFPLVLGPFFGMVGVILLIVALWLRFRRTLTLSD